MTRIAWFCVVLAVMAPARAQIGDAPIQLPVRIIQYLDLTRDQILDLGRLELEWQRYISSKVRRVAQVEREIREVTLAPTVDPSALGVRYLELEAICREARATDAQIRERARRLLNDAQRARLRVLEQAYALLPEIAQADAVHLMDAPLPGLDLSRTGAQAPRAYPGCRFPAPQPVMHTPAAGPENEKAEQQAVLRHPQK